MLVIPGGADEPYMDKLGLEGCALIRDFVEKGGAYLGLCAGAYFACDRFEFNKGLAGGLCRSRPMKLFKGRAVGSLTAFAPPYDESLATAALVKLRMTQAGFRPQLRLVGDEGGEAPVDERAAVYYHGGPVFVDLADDPDAVVMAIYEDLPDGENAAVLYKKFGQGRVVLCGAHPEVSAEGFAARLRSENNPQAFSHILNGLENLTTGRENLIQNMLAMLLPEFLN